MVEYSEISAATPGIFLLMKTLLIVRHAKSSWKDSDLADHERPLNSRGLRDAPRMGRYLARKGYCPDLVLTSSAARALSTAEHLIQGAGWNLSPRSSTSFYLAGANDIANYISTLPAHVDTALFVGHNPGVAELVSELTCNVVAMPTAAVAVIQLEIGRWRDISVDGVQQLEHHWYPKGLPATFD